MIQEKRHLYLDLAIILSSITAAIIFAESGLIMKFVALFDGYQFVASFLSGAFFTSAFTSAPATVALGALSLNNHPLYVGVFGAVGSLFGDLVIFRFIKSHISMDFDYVLKQIKWEEFKLKFHHPFFKALRWLFPLFGALLIASPLPDEIGLMILGLSKVKTRWVAVLSVVLNFIGIVIVGLIARAIQ